MADLRSQHEANAEIQQRYAATLQAFVTFGLVVLLVTFGLYISGTVSSVVRPKRVTELWHLSSRELMDESGREPGWSWVGSITSGDAMSFASIVLIASGSIVNLLLILPAFWRRRDWWYLGIAGAQVVVLVLAAGGVFSV